MGKTHTGYRYLHKTRELTCDLGCKHTATLHEVREITETSSSYELVPYLDYDKPAYGTILHGQDAEGHTYTKTPQWGGAGPWVRDGQGEDEFEFVYWDYPIVRMDIALNVDNNAPIG